MLRQLEPAHRALALPQPIVQQPIFIECHQSGSRPESGPKRPEYILRVIAAENGLHKPKKVGCSAVDARPVAIEGIHEDLVGLQAVVHLQIVMQGFHIEPDEEGPKPGVPGASPPVDGQVVFGPCAVHAKVEPPRSRYRVQLAASEFHRSARPENDAFYRPASVVLLEKPYLVAAGIE